MKRNFIAALLVAVFISPLAHAQGSYAGVFLGSVKEDGDGTDNIGFVIGKGFESGFGVEAFYSTTMDEESFGEGNIDVDVSIDTYGVMAVYKTSGDIYFKGKAGIAGIDIEFDAGNLGSIDEDETGFAYGFAVGSLLGPGDLELSYTALPELEDIEGIEVDAEFEMIGISYLWHF